MGNGLCANVAYVVCSGDVRRSLDQPKDRSATTVVRQKWVLCCFQPSDVSLMQHIPRSGIRVIIFILLVLYDVWYRQGDRRHIPSAYACSYLLSVLRLVVRCPNTVCGPRSCRRSKLAQFVFHCGSCTPIMDHLSKAAPLMVPTMLDPQWLLPASLI